MERTSIEVMDMSTELNRNSEEGKEEPKLVKGLRHPELPDF
jgi:hypothetical protein